MPKLNRKLTEAEIKNARPKAKDYKLYDTEGLRLLVRTSGSKVWQMPYILNGKANIYTIGKYDPIGRVGFIGSAEARRLRDEAKALVRQGIDPNQTKKSLRASEGVDPATTFEAIAREWHGKQIWDQKHSRNILMTLEKDVFPAIGAKPINKVTVRDILSILDAVEKRNALDVAKRINQRCTAIFDYAIARDLCETNPATGRSRTIKARKTQHRPHIAKEYLPEFIREIDKYRGSRKVALAMKLLLLTFVRPGELRKARWKEFNEEKAEWLIPAERMKMKRKHLVPLSEQALEVLSELREITGKGDLLFPSELNSDKPISDVTLIKMIKIIGFHTGEKKLVPHGIRATASTILNESALFRNDVIELQLSHVEKNKIRGAYNHAEYLNERISMMQWWGNYINQEKVI